MLSKQNERLDQQLENKIEELVSAQTEIRTQEHLTAKEKAENSAMVQSEFLANMSHEIRTPLGAIIGFADLLQQWDDLTSEQVALYTSSIHESGELLMKIINDILSLSKINAGKVVIRETEVDIRDLSHKIYNLLHHQAERKSIDFKIVFADDLPREITTDAIRLRQILINLVSDAIKFTDCGGVTMEVTSKKNSSSQRIKFSIIDTGLGIRSEKLGTIFQPFTQVNKSETKTNDGTGLGLSISQKLAELLGGNITVSSQWKKGSNFSFDLPRYPEFEIKLEGGYSPRILLVEDNAMNQLLIKKLLSKEGCLVEVAFNGQDAITRLLDKKEIYDIVLMDLQMPVMSGFEAIKILKSNNYRSPVVAITANALDSTKEQCKEFGFNGFFTKPIDLKALIAFIHEHLGSAVSQKTRVIH